jgi:polyphenol oxidase
MSFQQAGPIRYFTFDSFDEAGVKHGVLTRLGGVSPEPWSSLNVGGTVGDIAHRVAENRRRSFQAFQRSPESGFDVWLVHSADVVITRSARSEHEGYRKADVILTDVPEVTLFMRFADCVPILLYDPVRKAVGLVHAGWPGTVKKAAAAAVEAMQAEYHTRPEDLLAGIGPSIAAHHYPVRQDVIDQVEDAFGEEAASLLISHSGEVQFDLWKANHLVLSRAGVKRIEISGICTACSTDEWFSHRAENGKTGRFGALIAL